MNRRALTIGELRTGPVGARLASRRPRRRSALRTWGRFTAGLLVLTAVGWFGHWLLRSPTFAVDQVVSGGYRYTCEADLERIFGAWLGRNIFTLSGKEIASELTTLPWIRDLRVRRRLPSRVTVELIEWRPVAAVATTASDPQRQDLVLREDGRVLPFPNHLDRPGLPVLIGVEPQGARDGLGQVLPKPWATATVELMAAIEAVGLEVDGPVDFLVAGPSGFAIVMQTGRTRLLVGKEDFTARLERYLTARGRIPGGAEVDLRFRGRVSYHEPNAAAAPASLPKERT